jgi:hypothetical protein
MHVHLKHSHFAIGVSAATLLLLLILIALSYTATLPKRRDAERIQDIRHLEEALAIYQATYQSFPTAPQPVFISGLDDISAALTASDAIAFVPTDPLYPTYAYVYSTDERGNTYTIQFCLETDSIKNYAQGCENTMTP